MMRRVVFMAVLGVVLASAPKAFCPERCICRKAADGASSPVDIKVEIDAEIDTGWIVKCGGSDTNKIISIKEIEFGEIEDQISHLDLSRNKISYVEFENFVNMTSLKRLDLSLNSIRQVDETAFGDMKTLEKLNLRSNQIEHVFQGSFDGLPELKLLDISLNPLACNCDLLWLVSWSKNMSIKLQPKPKCATPAPFKNEFLSKLKIGSDLHCDSPLQQFLEMSPDTSQLIFEGDALTLRCRAPRLAAGGVRDAEDVLPPSNIFWGWSETIISPESNQDIHYHDPQSKFPSITVDIRHLAESGLIDSILRIPYTTRNHSGTWDCRIRSLHDAELSRSVTVLVISNKTQYCMPEISKSNRGAYSWPKTIRGRTVNLPCQYETPGSYATHTCGQSGQWENLNVTFCPFVMETTRLLEQFSTVNLSLAPASVISSARNMSDYTRTNIFLGHLMDPVDVVFLAKIVENYLDFVPAEPELGGILLDIVTHVMLLNRAILQRAQNINMTCSRLLTFVEQVGFTATQVKRVGPQDIEMYRIPSEKFYGVTCTWLKSDSRAFQCVAPSNYHTLPFNERTEASIQLPQIALVPSENLLITAFKNANLFPDNKTNFVITSAVVGVKFRNIVTLQEPVIVMLRPRPYHNEKSAPRPVLWDPELGTWTNVGCSASRSSHGVVVFTCSRLGYYGLMQNVNFLNDFEDERAGRKFRLSPPGFYVGGFVLFFCLWINITTYAVAGKQIQMPQRLKHSLINTWVALSALVFAFTLGIFQTENFDICQVFGIVLHYLCLSSLLWICVTFSQFHRRLAYRRRGEEDLRRERKPISGLYFVGWGVGMLICGISGAINMEEYATYHYCFMKPVPAISAIFVPTAVVLLFVLITVVRIRFTIKSREISAAMTSEGTQMTEQVDLDNLDAPPQMNRSVSMSTRTTNMDDHEHSLRAQIKSHLIVLVLVLETFAAAAIATGTPFADLIAYEEEIFSVIYAISATILGLFILFFFGISRSDVRLIWSTINCSLKQYRSGYTCRPTTSNILAFKEFSETNQPPTAPTVVYQANTNVSRSNSQCSKNQSSNGVVKIGGPAEPPFMHRFSSDNFSSTPPNNAEMFYNPTQSHVARKFFRKQKRLQKQTNIEIQRRMDDTSSEVSSVLGCPPSRIKDVFGSGSKVNNLNLNPPYDKQFADTSSELLMNVTSDGLRLGFGGESLYSTAEEPEMGTLKVEDKFKRVLPSVVEEPRASSPMYINSPTKQPVAEEPTYFELEPPLNHLPISAMNTCGLPPVYKSNSTLKSNDSLNTVRVALNKDEAYVSAVAEITNHVTIRDGSMRIFEQRDGKWKSLTELPKSFEMEMEEKKSISCADLLETQPAQESPGSPTLVPPSLCDIIESPSTLADRRKPISFEEQEFFNQSLPRISTSSPVSELQYQNSELSLQSQEFYAPPDNDLNIILAKNLNIDFPISDEEDEDEVGNCSRDYLLEEGGDLLNESGSIDELYQQIKQNQWRRRDEEDFLNENSESEESASHLMGRIPANHTPLDVLNDN